MFEKILENVRAGRPLVHSITNYVTVNDVANTILACGGSPIMSDEPEEAEAITSICNGLNINIGTLNRSSIEAMFMAGRRAVELEHPILLDPVGAGASSLRTETALAIIEEIKPDVIKGNISEIKALALNSSSTKGVDANIEDAVTEENLEASIEFIQDFARKTGSVIACTGGIDLVSDGIQCYVIRNGRPEMETVTGTGCSLAGLMTTYIAANPDSILEAAAAAVCVMGLAGEIAMKRMQAGDGNATYRSRIIDAIYNIDAAELNAGAKITRGVL